MTNEDILDLMDDLSEVGQAEDPVERLSKHLFSWWDNVLLPNYVPLKYSSPADLVGCFLHVPYLEATEEMKQDMAHTLCRWKMVDFFYYLKHRGLSPTILYASGPIYIVSSGKAYVNFHLTQRGDINNVSVLPFREEMSSLYIHHTTVPYDLQQEYETIRFRALSGWCIQVEERYREAGDI